MARRAAYLDSVWNEEIEVLIVDGGDLFGRRNKNERYQTRFLCEMTAALGIDAIGVGEKDFNYGLKFLNEMIDTYDLPFTSANIYNKASDELMFPEYIVVERNGIKFGLVSVLAPNQKIITMTSDESEIVVKDALAALRTVIPKLRKEADCVILLGHLGEGNTEDTIREVKGIDICLLGHTFKNYKSERFQDETLMLASSPEAKYLGRCDLFVDDSNGEVMAASVSAIDFGPEVADDPEMLAKVNAYKADLEEFKKAKRAEYPRVHGSDKEMFVGERTCKGCHEQEWSAFTESGHRKAFQTLRTRGQNFEPECLSCHTTGYQYKEGYADESPYNRLVNVQCEACHGYGSEHNRGGDYASRAKDSCVVCHDKENSPEFDYATYWEKIKH